MREPESSASPATSPRRKWARKRFLIGGLVLLAALGLMIYSAMASNSEYYLTVSEVYALGEKAQQSPVKVGGKVVEGSILWDRSSNSVRFAIADDKGKTLPVTYTGVVPDSFQPGGEVIVEGKLRQDGSFAATTLLAKCASKYEPQIPGLSK